MFKWAEMSFVKIKQQDCCSKGKALKHTRNAGSLLMISCWVTAGFPLYFQKIKSCLLQSWRKEVMETVRKHLNETEQRCLMERWRWEGEAHLSRSDEEGMMTKPPLPHRGKDFFLSSQRLTEWGGRQEKDGRRGIKKKKTRGQELPTDCFSSYTTWRKEERREEERIKGQERRKHQHVDQTWIHFHLRIHLSWTQ